MGGVQEAGRAGRDGQAAECVLMTSASDAIQVAGVLRAGKCNKAQLQKNLELLEKVRRQSMQPL